MSIQGSIVDNIRVNGASAVGTGDGVPLTGSGVIECETCREFLEALRAEPTGPGVWDACRVMLAAGNKSATYALLGRVKAFSGSFMWGHSAMGVDAWREWKGHKHD